MLSEFETVTNRVELSFDHLMITSLLDQSQFPPSLNNTEQHFDETSWPIFGKIWPSAIVLTEYLHRTKIPAGGILEIGCGLGIPSLILSKLGYDITSSDGNSYSRTFLEMNARQNGILPPKFIDIDWRSEYKGPKFEVIIGSDIIYDRNHPDELAKFFDVALEERGTIILCDPNRSLFQKLKAAMALVNFNCTQENIANLNPVGKEFKILTLKRSS
jgi:predicted nicotinamide N-methyase